MNVSKPRTQLVLSRKAFGQNPQLIVKNETMTMDDAEEAGYLEYRLDHDRDCWLITSLTDEPITHAYN